MRDTMPLLEPQEMVAVSIGARPSVWRGKTRPAIDTSTGHESCSVRPARTLQPLRPRRLERQRMDGPWRHEARCGGLAARLFPTSHAQARAS